MIAAWAGATARPAEKGHMKITTLQVPGSGIDMLTDLRGLSKFGFCSCFLKP